MYNILSLVSCCELESKFFLMKETIITILSVMSILLLIVAGIFWLIAILFDMVNLANLGTIILVGAFVLLCIIDQYMKMKGLS